MSDINARTEEGHTALMYADKNGYTDIVRTLKNAGAKDDNIEPALINTAGMTGRMDMIEYFIGKGANVNAQDDYGHSALIEATIIEDSKIIRYLIEHGADVNIKDNQGATALSVAQHYGYREVINLLKKAGAKE
jgi:ankyrin repeat protein